jgi:hypothetical protein
MSNTTMTMTAATRPFAPAASTDASWCGGIAGSGAHNSAMSLAAHRIRLTDLVPAPQNGRDGFVGSKQGRPPRGEPR